MTEGLTFDELKKELIKTAKKNAKSDINWFNFIKKGGFTEETTSFDINRFCEVRFGGEVSEDDKQNLTEIYKEVYVKEVNKIAKEKELSAVCHFIQ